MKETFLHRPVISTTPLRARTQSHRCATLRNAASYQTMTCPAAAKDSRDSSRVIAAVLTTKASNRNRIMDRPFLRSLLQTAKHQRQTRAG